jgi:hypothetical protein
MMGSTPFWYQLYWSTDEALVDSMICRAESCGAGALVITLDTTILGWRPQDLNLGSLPFARGHGIAQYTSDPRFTKIIHNRTEAATDRPKTRLSLGAVRTLVSMSKQHPGPLGKICALRSRGLRLRRFSRSTPTRDCLGITSRHFGTARPCRSCSKESFIPMTRAKR